MLPVYGCYEMTLIDVHRFSGVKQFKYVERIPIWADIYSIVFFGI